jgi:hypothetical protein
MSKRFDFSQRKAIALSYVHVKDVSFVYQYKTKEIKTEPTFPNIRTSRVLRVGD